MPTDRDDLIAGLAADLQPVTPMKRSSGLLLVALATLATVGVVVTWEGLAPTLASGQVSSNTALANGLLLMLGTAAAVATVAMALPRVGTRYDGPKWATATASIFPAAGMALLMQGSMQAALIDAEHGWRCAVNGSLAAVFVAVALLFWLRRGAPVALHRAGLWLGVAAGALGSVAYGLTCPLDGVSHLGIWHFLPAAICAGVGSLVVPRLVRW
mgnify:CR=1 FL=1